VGVVRDKIERVTVALYNPCALSKEVSHGVPLGPATELWQYPAVRRAARRLSGEVKQDMRSSTSRPWRISGIAGLLFVLTSFVASAINVQPPSYNQDPAAIAAWFTENSQRYRVGHFVAGLSFLLFYVPFFAGLCERLRAVDDAPAIWSRVAWGGAILSPAAGTTSGAFIVGAALLGKSVSPDIARFAMAANFYGFVVSGALSGIVMLGASVVIVRTGVFARWLGWSGAVIAVIAILGSAAIVGNDPAGLFATVNGLAWLAYFIWIAALAVSLVFVGGRPTTASQ
jgi:hypothetical protein